MTEEHQSNPTTTTQLPAQRFYDLDALRVTAMFLVIVFHVSIPYMDPPFFCWAAMDCSRNAFFGHFANASLAICLSIFFLLAGFFGNMIWKKRGLIGFIKNRIKRIVIPLALAAVIIIPLVQISFIAGIHRMEEARIAQIESIGIDLQPYRMSVADFYSSGTFVREKFRWYHLWFLWYLIFHYVIFLILVPLAKPALASGWPDRFFERIVQSRFKPLILAIPTVILLCPMVTWGADTPSKVEPMPRILLYYLLFFGFGCMLYRQPNLLSECGKNWKTHLFLGLLVALPALIYLKTKSILPEGGLDGTYRIPVLICNSHFICLMVFGLMGLYQHYVKKPNDTIRYMADASYLCYIIHLPFMIFLQIATKDIQMPAIVKSILVFIVIMLPLILTYHYFVRHNSIMELVKTLFRRKSN